MEKDGILDSDVRNKIGYDKTKCYKILNWSPWMPAALDYEGEKRLKQYMDTTQPPENL